MSEVREFLPKDWPAVLAMLDGSEPWRTLGYTAEDWQRLLAPLPAGREGYVVASSGGAVAFGLLRRGFLLGDYLELFVVARDQRGSGLGGKLLEGLESRVFGRSKNLWVCVSDFNEGARRFYARHGFHEVGAASDLLIAGHAEILLRKSTGPLRLNSPTTARPDKS